MTASAGPGETVRRKRRHTLAVRLLVLFLVTGVALVVIIAAMFSGAWRYRFEDFVMPHLEQYVVYIQEDIGSPPDLEAAQRLAGSLPVDIAIIGPDMRWTSLPSFPDENAMRFDHGHQVGERRVHVGEYGREQYVAQVENDGYRVMFLTGSPEHGGKGVVARWVTIVLVLLVLAAAYHAIRRMLRPIEALDRVVSRIGAGELDARIELQRRDELGALANSFNHMAGEIQAMLEAKRELLLAISHELRSPLTRANVSGR